jgi:hypothetical protein
MTISYDCLLSALAPFASPDDWLALDRLLAKVCASRFELRSDELSAFDLWWQLTEPGVEVFTPQPAAPDAEVRAAFGRLAAIVNEGVRYTEVGYRHVGHVPGTGSFVVFSDHHMAFAGSRQDFFRSSGNRDLYAEILAQYASAGYTLIENGDVEELVIHEPSASAAQARLDLLARVKDVGDVNDPGWAALDALRVDERLDQLSRVIDNHRDLYRQINTDFVEKGRYIRIAGNHDQDTQDPRFLTTLRQVYPGLGEILDS